MRVKINKEQKVVNITSPNSIVPTMQQILKREDKLGRGQEHFWVVGLCSRNKILYIELIGLGQHNRVAANPPDVFRLGIYKQAVKLILVHNHPSGDLTPSSADFDFTDRILKVGEILSIEVCDHIIISETAYESFAEIGMIEKLKKRDTWRLVGKGEEDVRQMKEEMLKESVEKNARKIVALKLKELGLSELIIKQSTGLSIREIRKL